jgi:hypothetical protein
MNFPRFVTITILIPLVAAGCASLPYEAGTCDQSDPMPLRESEPQIERGRPHALLDGFGHYVLSLPGKLLLLSWSVDNHRISQETEQAMVEYLQGNSLCHVKVRLNQYSVPGEWSRLFRNRSVGAGWRYTFGILTTAFYTAFPGRLCSGLLILPCTGDSYNPFTNTISLYSDSEAITLHEGAHAKDFAGRRRRKGLYAALRILPLVPLYQEAKASRDAVSYQRDNLDYDGERSSYPMLWGAWTTYVVGEWSRWFSGAAWVTYAVLYPSAWFGKFAGKVKALTTTDPVYELPPPAEPPEASPDAL